MSVKIKNRKANSVDSNRVDLVTSHLIWIYSVCKGVCFGLKGRKGKDVTEDRV